MERNEVECSVLGKMIERAAKEAFVTAVFTPAIVVFVHIAPVHAPDRQILPLDSGVENVENVVKYLVVRKPALLPACSLREVRRDEAVEFFARDFGRQRVVSFSWWTLGLLFLLSGVHEKRVQYWRVNLDHLPCIVRFL